GPLVIFVVRDRVTGLEGALRTATVGLEQTSESKWRMLRDWEVIKLLNPLADKPRSAALGSTVGPASGVERFLADAAAYLESHLSELGLPFLLPAVERLACLVPARSDDR